MPRVVCVKWGVGLRTPPFYFIICYVVIAICTASITNLILSKCLTVLVVKYNFKSAVIFFRGHVKIHQLSSSFTRLGERRTVYDTTFKSALDATCHWAWKTSRHGVHQIRLRLLASHVLLNLCNSQTHFRSSNGESDFSQRGISYPGSTLSVLIFEIIKWKVISGQSALDHRLDHLGMNVDDQTKVISSSSSYELDMIYI